MHVIEPFEKWLSIYDPVDDEKSPFFNQEYNEEFYEKKIYNYYIHPYWDDIESETLYIKVLFVDYKINFCIIELMGEWNDVLHNDIMHLKRNLLDIMLENGISKYILIAENILDYHHDDDSYYEEWREELSDNDGWVYMINLQEHVYQEYNRSKTKNYIPASSEENNIEWRKLSPQKIFELFEGMQMRRIEM